MFNHFPFLNKFGMYYITTNYLTHGESERSRSSCLVRRQSHPCVYCTSLNTVLQARAVVVLHVNIQRIVAVLKGRLLVNIVLPSLEDLRDTEQFCTFTER